MFFIKENILLVESEGKVIFPTADQIYSSIFEGKQNWSDIPSGKNSTPIGLKFSKYPVVPQLVLELHSSTQKPQLSLKFTNRGSLLRANDLRFILAGHLIEDGTWFPLEVSSKTEILDLLDAHGAALGELHSLRTFLDLKKAALEGKPVLDRTAEATSTYTAFFPKTNAVPRGIEASLYNYQLSGWNWLRFLVAESVGGILADEMGLGKTLQIISLVNDPGERPLSSTLIVAPGSLLENWCREIKRFAPKLKVLKHHGHLRTGHFSDLGEYDIVVTSYETVVRDQSMFLMVQWDLIVADEAQNIKNPEAKRTMALKSLKRNVAIAVTGTPVENKLLDVWSLVDFVLPGYLGDQNHFVYRYGNAIDGAARLEPILSPLMLRRRVHEVADDLPERIDIPQVVQLDNEEAISYEKERKRIIEDFGAAASLVTLSSLRMFCCHPTLLNSKKDERYASVEPLSFSKFRRLDEILQEIVSLGEKAIVFTSYTTMADMITQHVLRRYGVFSACIDGRLKIEARQPLIDEFSEFQGAGVLVLNPKAGGTGLNITAANHVIHYNLEWNPALEDQASARAYRRGQSRPVTVHRLFSGNTVEEVIDGRLSQKRELINASVVGVSGDTDAYKDIMSALQQSPLVQTKE